MTDPLMSARFGLPFLSVGQAQKEVTHNEALTLIDALVQCSCEAGPQAVPPTTPLAGQCWIVGAGAGGDWTGEDNAIALWTDGGWRFIAPSEGMRCLRLSDTIVLRYEDSGWALAPTVTPPTGGATIDSVARDAILDLINALSAQGLLISG